MKKYLRDFLKKLFYFFLRIGTHKKVKKVQKMGKVFLEIGAGSKKGTNGWTTLDIGRDCDICWDLRKGIPFPNNSIDGIYTSHTLEHIPFKDLLKLIKECLRCLKIEGYLSVSVPSAKYYIDAYSSKKYFRKNGEGWGLGLCDTGSFIDQINYIAYMGSEHKYMFDEENLINLLRKCGFSKVSLRDFDSERLKEQRL